MLCPLVVPGRRAPGDHGGAWTYSPSGCLSAIAPVIDAAPVCAGLGSFRFCCDRASALNLVWQHHRPDANATMLSDQNLYGLMIPRVASNSPPPAGPQLNILVVEDDPIVGMVLMETLMSMGHTVCAVRATASGAVAAATRYVPDLMLVDTRLGRGSGVAAVAQIRQYQDIPLIYMSGSRIPGRRPTDIVLYKPFVERDLALAIFDAMMRHRAEPGTGHGSTSS